MLDTPPLDWFSILSLSLCITAFRFLVSGTQRKFTQKIPNLFNLLAEKFAKPNKRKKFNENLWYSIWHTISFCMVLRAIYNAQWFEELLFKGEIEASTESREPFQPFQLEVYKVELAFWISCLQYLFFEGYRSDTPILFIHHIATISLVWLSYQANVVYIGLLVMILHDVSDIFLYMAKLFSYTGMNAKVTDVIFQIFAISFMVTRISLYPITCVTPALKYVLGWTKSPRPQIHSREASVCSILLCVLQGLHVYWFYLIIKIAVKQMKNENAEDIRSETESAEDDLKTPSTVREKLSLPDLAVIHSTSDFSKTPPLTVHQRK